MIAIGADGCHGGWLATRVEAGVVKRLHVFRTADALWSAWGDADLVFVDIPIGLRDGGAERECDLEARRRLGRPRGASVFVVPSRHALTSSTYEEASARNEAATGRRISLQAWSIVPKIAEMDRLLRSDPRARERIRESHPEVCFWALAGHPTTLPKTTRQGLAERLAAVQLVLPAAGHVFDRAVEAFPRSAVRPDDVVDSLVLAVSAALARRGLETLPAEPERDGQGLPMEIVFPSRSGLEAPAATDTAR